MSSVAVSIINYKTGEMTIAAAQSVLDCAGDRPVDVIIVDNASGDGSDVQIATWIEQLGNPRVKLVRSTLNSGFSGGHNQGIAAAPNADFYLIMNSDALLRPGFFDAILPEVEKDQGVGLVAPQLEREDATPQVSCFRFANPLNELVRAAETAPITKLFAFRDVIIENPPPAEQIEWASFACILLRGAMVREIGPMDEGYFLYYEDAEYALRARRAQWKVSYIPTARAVHFRGGSGPIKEMQAKKKRLPSYYWRSRTRFMRQAHGVYGPLLANLAWVIGRLAAQLRRIAGRKVPLAHKREWTDIWIGFFNPLKPDVEPRK